MDRTLIVNTMHPRRQRGGAVSRRRAGRGPAHRRGAAGRGPAARRRARHRRRRRHADARAHRAARPRELPRRRLELGLHAPAARGAHPRHHAQCQDHARLRLHERAVGRRGQAAARRRDPQRDQRRPHPRPALPRQWPGDHRHRRARRRERAAPAASRDADLHLGRRRARRDPEGLPPARARGRRSPQAQRLRRHRAAQQPRRPRRDDATPRWRRPWRSPAPPACACAPMPAARTP